MDEKWVEYLFARFHHLLGFEKVLEWRIYFPDVVALRNGKRTRIELESSLEHIINHYYVFGTSDYRHHWSKGEWIREGTKWVWKYKRKPMYIIDDGTDEINDPTNNIYLDRGTLKYRSIKPFVDVIVCWDAHKTWSIYKKLQDEGIEIIILKEVLPKLGVTW